MTQHRLALWVILTFLVFATNGLHAAENWVIQEGQAKALLLLSEKPHDYEAWAAQELQSHFQKMTGAKLQIQKVAKADGATPAILVGNRLVLATYPEEAATLKSLTMDGIVLKTKGQHLLIFGHGTRGTLFAAYEFLDQQGVRWYTPDCTVIPKKTTVAYPATDLVYSPKIWLREYLVGYWENPNKHIFNARNRLNKQSWDKQESKFGGHLEFYHKPHNFKALFLKPLDGMTSDFKKHPDMWSLRKGKRSQAQVCLTNEKVYTLFVAHAKKYFTDNPTSEFLMVGQEDNWNYCQCESCEALTQKHGSPAATMVHLLNRMMTEVEKDFPTKKLRFFAYQWTQKPPVDLPMHPKLIVYLANILCDFSSPIQKQATRENKEFFEAMKGWAKLANEIHIWTYNTCFGAYFIPWPNLHSNVKDLKFFVDNKVTGMFYEASHRTKHSDFMRMRAWMMARAIWNPDRYTEQELMEDFCRGYYGPAADDILKYIDVMHEAVDSKTLSLKISNPMLASATITPESIVKGYGLLQAAAKKVAGDEVLTQRGMQVRASVDMVLIRRGRNSKTYQQTLAQHPDMTYGTVADRIKQVASDTKARLIASNGQPIKPFLAYTQLVRNKTAAEMIPPELKDKAYTVCFQAGQFDGRSSYMKAVPDASDGWALRLPPKVYMNAHNISPALGHYDPDKPMTIHYRIRPSQLVSDSKQAAFHTNVFTGERIMGRWSLTSHRFMAKDLKPGVWQTVSFTPNFKTKPAEWLRIVFVAHEGVGKDRKKNYVDVDYFYITQE